MRLTPLRRALAGSAAVAAVAVFALATTATAQPEKPALNSGDERAVAYDGNVDIKHDNACTVGGLTGTPIAPGEFTFTGGVNELDLDITVAPENVIGVVVKGSDAYNVYLAAKLGALPWNDLRSPDKNDKAPEISHWYACGIVKQEPPKEEPPKEEPPKEEPPKEQPPVEETPSSTVTVPPSSSEVAPTSTSAPAAAAAEDLASTGFGSAWLVGLGAALLAAGAAVLLVLRRRRA